MLACIAVRRRCAERIAPAISSRSSSQLSSRAYRQDHQVRLANAGARKVTSPSRDQQKISRSALVEQLLPSRDGSEVKSARPERTIPRLPLHSLNIAASEALHDNNGTSYFDSVAKQNATDQFHGIPPTLFIGNASKNLTIEDFRRVVPRGEHIPGWIHEEGDIVNVIPYRNAHDLAQQNSYYLVFASQASASAYRKHVKQIHMLARLHNRPGEFQLLPTTRSDLPLDYNEERFRTALANFTIISPDQDFRIHHVHEPVAPNLAHMLKSGGLEVWRDRPRRKAFEIRMTLDGPQLSVTQLQEIFHASSKDRDINWSGGPEVYLSITKWVNTSHKLEETASRSMLPKVRESDYRVPDPVYIVGFDTEYAAMSFLSYWHNQPVEHQSQRSATRQASTDASMRDGIDPSQAAPRLQLSILW